VLKVKHSNTKEEETAYIEVDEHVYEEINFYTQLKPESDGQEGSVPRIEISPPLSKKLLRWVDVPAVANSGVLGK
jgi:hypothetical protein